MDVNTNLQIIQILDIVFRSEDMDLKLIFDSLETLQTSFSHAFVLCRKEIMLMKWLTALTLTMTLRFMACLFPLVQGR